MFLFLPSSAGVKSGILLTTFGVKRVEWVEWVARVAEWANGQAHHPSMAFAARTAASALGECF